MVPNIDHDLFLSHPLRVWLSLNLKRVDSSYGVDWPQMFGMALYFLWQVHNKEIFERVVLTPKEMLGHFWSFYVTCNGLPNLHEHDRSGLRKELFISWKHPLDRWIKVNNDGSLLADHKAACGGLLGMLWVALLEAFRLILVFVQSRLLSSRVFFML